MKRFAHQQKGRQQKYSKQNPVWNCTLISFELYYTDLFNLRRVPELDAILAWPRLVLSVVVQVYFLVSQSWRNNCPIFWDLQQALMFCSIAWMWHQNLVCCRKHTGVSTKVPTLAWLPFDILDLGRLLGMEDRMKFAQRVMFFVNWTVFERFIRSDPGIWNC